MAAGTVTDPAGSPGLRPVLALWEVTAAGVAIIVGAGVYVIIGEAAGEAGAAVWLSFLVAGALSGLTALSYAELASMFPRAGAAFEYTSRAFPPVVAFLAGWSMAVALVIAVAAVALGFGQYFGEFVDVDARIPAAALVLASIASTAAGVKESVRLGVALSVVEVGGLVFIAVVGAPSIGDVGLLEGATVGGVLSGAALVFFAYIGFEEVTTLAEETRDPSKTIPRALLLALGISTVVYTLTAIAAVSVIGPAELVAAERPLAEVARTVFSDGAGAALAVVAMVATASTALLALNSTSRILFGMARAGAIPRSAAAVSARTGVPIRAIVVSGVVGLVFVASGDLGLVAGATDALIYVVFVAVNLAAIVLRFRMPDAPRPFRAPLSVGKLPVTPVLAIAVALVFVGRLELVSMLIALGLAGAGLVLYTAYQRAGGGVAAAGS
ncbi:MAG: amino acid permease [Thermoflexaceae bacterium]|nr:amino acid permease [Thermoflexaceae bacterium]